MNNKMYLKICIIVLCISAISCQQSPCPDIYQTIRGRNSNENVGLVEIKNLRPGQTVRLNVDLSLPTQLSSEYVGYIESVDTFSNGNGIVARYRVIFPVQNVQANVLRISVNGQTVCSGYAAQGRVVTTIYLEYTIQTPSNTRQRVRVDQFLPTTYNSNEDDNVIGNTVDEYIRPFDIPEQTPRQWQQTPTERTVRPRITTPPVRTTTTRRSNQGASVTDAQTTCGEQGGDFSRRISGGEIARKGEWPWLVAIFRTVRKGTLEFICGATLISNHHVITAAHCLRDDRNLTIKAGQLLLSLGRNNIDDFLEQDTKYAKVETSILHPEYGVKANSFDADIGLIILEEYITFTDFIKPVCLWNDANPLSVVVGQSGTVAGWGLTEQGVLATVAKKSEAAIVSNSDCVRQDNLFLLSTTERTFCAGGQGSGPCMGDSGGGFVMNRNGRWYFRGIVSHSLLEQNTMKCDVNKFAVYTDVAKFSSWINGYLS